jgi:FkbM family methyltransferase
VALRDNRRLDRHGGSGRSIPDAAKRTARLNVPATVAVLGSRVGRASALTRVLRPAYGRALETVYGRRGLPWSINGESFRIIPGLRHLLPPVNEAPLFRFLSEQIRQGDLVFDVGAFLGTYAMLAARRSGQSGRVVAFEPSPDSFRALERHVAMNGLHAPRIVVRCTAVGARSERRRLMTFDEEPYRNMIAPPGVEGSDAVNVVTIDDVEAEIGRPPDWVRMDVQGLEFDVLAGAASVVRESGGRLRIVAEVHPEQWPGYGVQPSEAVERLAALGLRARPLEAGRDPFEQGSHAILESLR